MAAQGFIEVLQWTCDRQSRLINVGSIRDPIQISLFQCRSRNLMWKRCRALIENAIAGYGTAGRISVWFLMTAIVFSGCLYLTKMLRSTPWAWTVGDGFRAREKRRATRSRRHTRIPDSSDIPRLADLSLFFNAKLELNIWAG